MESKLSKVGSKDTRRALGKWGRELRLVDQKVSAGLKNAGCYKD